jgi:4-hydroxy-3-methylbut-2-en-1-yl diphosphate reductase
VGDRKSSNSNRLREVAERRGKNAYLIHDAAEINPIWLHNVKSIGMTAGASTPEEVVQAVINRLKEMGVDETEEVIHTEENVLFQLPKAVLSGT